MKEQIISFETSKLLTHTLFSQKDGEDGYMIATGELSTDYLIDWLNRKAITAPTQGLLQKWFREVHHIDVEARGCRYAGDSTTDYYQPYMNGAVLNLKKYTTYELALEFALTEALKQITP